MQAVLSHWGMWHWFALAVLLGILDVAVGANFLFVWCGLSAVLVGVLVLVLPLSLEFQWLFFGLGVMASLLIWKKYLRKCASAQPGTLNRRTQGYVGRIFTLETAIVDGTGKVRIGDSVWQVSGEDMPVETKVRVVAADGTLLKVERA